MDSLDFQHLLACVASLALLAVVALTAHRLGLRLWSRRLHRRAREQLARGDSAAAFSTLCRALAAAIQRPARSSRGALRAHHGRLAAIAADLRQLPHVVPTRLMAALGHYERIVADDALFDWNRLGGTTDDGQRRLAGVEEELRAALAELERPATDRAPTSHLLLTGKEADIAERDLRHRLAAALDAHVAPVPATGPVDQLESAALEDTVREALREAASFGARNARSSREWALGTALHGTGLGLLVVCVVLAVEVWRCMHDGWSSMWSGTPSDSSHQDRIASLAETLGFSTPAAVGVGVISGVVMFVTGVSLIRRGVRRRSLGASPFDARRAPCLYLRPFVADRSLERSHVGYTGEWLDPSVLGPAVMGAGLCTYLGLGLPMVGILTLLLSVLGLVSPPFLRFALSGRAGRRFEEELVGGLRAVGSWIAVGRPGEGAPPFGATRLYLPDACWREVVADLMANSRAIVLQMGMTSSLEWELVTALARVVPARLLIVFPGDLEDSAVRWRVDDSAAADERRAQYLRFRALAERVLPRERAASLPLKWWPEGFAVYFDLQGKARVIQFQKRVLTRSLMSSELAMGSMLGPFLDQVRRLPRPPRRAAEVLTQAIRRSAEVARNAVDELTRALEAGTPAEQKVTALRRWRGLHTSSGGDRT